MNIEEITANLWGFLPTGSTYLLRVTGRDLSSGPETLCVSVGEAAKHDNAKAAVAVNRRCAAAG